MLKYHIQTIELSSDQGSISFNSIPQNFNDLVITVSGRTTRTAGFEDAQIAINGSTASFSVRRLGGQGSGAAYSDSFTTSLLGQMNTDFSTANIFGNLTAYIPNYTASANKSISVEFVTENNATQAFQEIRSILWSNTAPVTSFALTTTFGTNFKAGTSVSLYGVRRGSDGLTTRSAVLATGGTVSTAGAYTVHTFTGSGTFVPAVNLETEYLVIAGGGGGGHFNTGAGAGGGGAGGYRSSVPGESSGGGASAESRLAVTAGTSYTVTVGAGGAGGQQSDGTQGLGSAFGSITSAGGGAGARGNNAGSSTGGTGGSGGGGGAGSGGSFAGAGTANQGFAGGTGGNNSTSYSAGGGGGAGGVGVNASGENVGGAGGPGLSSSITGSAVFRAGGGGGAILGAGGSGVGGTGSNGSGGEITAGATNTGSGGGGHYGGNTGQSGRPGGSGVVIIRYLTP